MTVIGSSTGCLTGAGSSFRDNGHYVNPRAPRQQSGNPDSGQVWPGLRVVGLGTRSLATREPKRCRCSPCARLPTTSSQAPTSRQPSHPSAHAEPRAAPIWPALPSSPRATGHLISWRIGMRNVKRRVDPGA